MIDGDARSDELAGLRDWLVNERELRGHLRDVRSAPAEGEMGAVVDALAVAVGSGGALTVLANALVNLAKQPRRVRLRVTAVAPDGRQLGLDIENMRPDDVAEVLRSALHTMDQSSSGAGAGVVDGFGNKPLASGDVS